MDRRAHFLLRFDDYLRRAPLSTQRTDRFVLGSWVIGRRRSDSVDRKKMVWATEAGALILVAILLGNSLLDNPSIAVIYIVAALFGFRGQLGVIVGPTIG